jgi:hypothetical protein
VNEDQPQEPEQQTGDKTGTDISAGGQYNEAVAVFGAPGMGKSYFMEYFLIERSKHCYIIAYDPTHSYKHNPHLVHRYNTPQELLGQGLKRNPQGIHCLDFADPETVLQTAISLCNTLKQQGSNTPVILAIDEATGFDTMMSPFRIHPSFQKAYLWRRHYRLGFVFGSQRPQAIHQTLYDSCTDMVLFRLTNKQAHKRLLEFGCPEEIVNQLGTLPKYQHLYCKPGEIVGDSPHTQEEPDSDGPPDSLGPETSQPSHADQSSGPAHAEPEG